MDDIVGNFFPIIKNHYPNVSIEEVKLFDDGHDHYVVLLPSGIAFRFPRGSEYTKKDAVENVFLADFAKQSPISIPVFTSHTDKQSGITYQTYQFIQGRQLSAKLVKTFSVEERLAIAKKLGSFLKILHAYPLENARAMYMDELDPNGYYDFFETIWPENRRTIYPILTKDEQQWCDQIFASYMETRERSFIPLVTHNDMLPEHIIVDDKKHKFSGVIDFALRIADPARDFMFFHFYGEDFLDTAITEYGEVDTTFKKRRTFYGGNFYVMYLYNAVAAKEKDIDAIEKHKQALSQYIAEYP